MTVPAAPISACCGFEPRVSILIPNFNNGKASSRTGQRDFIRDLLESLERTLRDETTPFEVLAFDDGSTDDSIDTLRWWAANKTWSRDGRPFLALTEAPHCGRLAVTANKLSRAAHGEFLVRLDGDIVCLTPNWVSRLCDIFDRGPSDLGIVGPKQLNVAGKIHEFGDWLLHPNGYHHNGHGLNRFAVRHAMEVDDCMGCFHCCRKRVYDEIGGYDEEFLRGQTVDFGVRARLAGWRCWAVPDIEYVHAHSERGLRETEADSSGGMQRSLDTFERKWGFNRIAPDLDYVRQRYAGTLLLWNAKWFGPAVEEAALPRAKPLSPDDTDWKRYGTDAAFRTATDLRAAVARDIARQAGPRKLVVQVGSGCGLMGHILAKHGLPYLGVDRDVGMVALAAAMSAREQYPGATPRFGHQGDPQRLPLDDGAADMVLLYDALERHPNPIGLLKEAKRVLAPLGILAIVARRATPGLERSDDLEHPYHYGQLASQLAVVGELAPLTRPDQDDPRREIVIAVQHVPATLAQTASPGAATTAGKAASQRTSPSQRSEPETVGAALEAA